MNNIIATLAEQAAQETATTETELNLEVSVDDRTYQIPGSFIERFAELIVKECSTLAYDGPGGILEHFELTE
jgi:uncharacterized protein (DUF111 family)